MKMSPKKNKESHTAKLEVKVKVNENISSAVSALVLGDVKK